MTNRTSAASSERSRRMTQVAAGTAFLNHRNPGTMTGGNTGRGDAAGTGADHDQVIVVDGGLRKGFAS